MPKQRPIVAIASSYKNRKWYQGLPKLSIRRTTRARGKLKSACLSLTHRAHYGFTQRSIKWSLAYGEDRARGLSDDFVGGGARQMRCGANAARGIADAENDKVRRAFFGGQKYPFGWVSIFDERLWREVKIGVGWNSFIKLMNGFGHGQLEPSLVVFTAFNFITAIFAASIAIGRFRAAHNVEENQFGFVFLRQ